MGLKWWKEQPILAFLCISVGHREYILLAFKLNFKILGDDSTENYH